jgi:hypothetical protein
LDRHANFGNLLGFLDAFKAIFKAYPGVPNRPKALESRH